MPGYFQNGTGAISKHVFINDRVQNVKTAISTFRNQSLVDATRQMLEGSGRINREFIHSFTKR